MLDVGSECFGHFVVLDETCSICSQIFVQQLWTLYTAGNTVQKNKFHMTKSFALPIITVNVAKISLDN